jgi:hypothetical protein
MEILVQRVPPVSVTHCLSESLVQMVESLVIIV